MCTAYCIEGMSISRKHCVCLSHPVNRIHSLASPTPSNVSPTRLSCPTLSCPNNTATDHSSLQHLPLTRDSEPHTQYLVQAKLGLSLPIIRQYLWNCSKAKALRHGGPGEQRMLSDLGGCPHWGLSTAHLHSSVAAASSGCLSRKSA